MTDPTWNDAYLAECGLEPETTAETVARLRDRGWGPAKILSGLGHPNYGTAFARQAIENIERFGLTAHEAVYGGRSAMIRMDEVLRAERDAAIADALAATR